jgi:hypothetical protein
MLFQNLNTQPNVSNVTTNTTTKEHAHSLLQQFLVAQPNVIASLNDNSDLFEFKYTAKTGYKLFVSDCMCNHSVEYIILSPTHVTTKTIWYDGTDYISTLPVEAFGKHNGTVSCQILVIEEQLETA